jgi:hypothetical protein
MTNLVDIVVTGAQQPYAAAAAAQFSLPAAMARAAR